MSRPRKRPNACPIGRGCMHCHSASELGNGAEKLRPCGRRKLYGDGEDLSADEACGGCAGCAPEHHAPSRIEGAPLTIRALSSEQVEALRSTLNERLAHLRT